jgi:hypothetical protein
VKSPCELLTSVVNKELWKMYNNANFYKTSLKEITCKICYTVMVYW